MNKYPIFILFFSIIISLINCKKDTTGITPVKPEPPDYSDAVVTLTINEIYCDSVSFEVKIKNLPDSNNVRLLKDGIKTTETTTTDTLFYMTADSLQWGGSYVFKAQVYKQEQLICQSEELPVTTLLPLVELELKYAGVTDMLLAVNMNDISDNRRIILKRDGNIVYEQLTVDSIHIIEDINLEAGHSYNYLAEVYEDALLLAVSEQQTFQTLPVTSHNFTWETFTFGHHSSSILYDVSIINENDIWAVGGIYLPDSVGQSDYEPYGAIHWNGNEWEPLKVAYHDYGTTEIRPGPLKSVFAINSNEVYVTSSANLLKWDGDSWEQLAFFMVEIPFYGQLRKTWVSENNIFCVGNNGAIYHYNGTTWQKLESGTDLPIQDIWGATDPVTGEEVVLCVACDKYEVSDKIILKIDTDDQLITHITWPFDNRDIHSIWYKEPNHKFICGAGVFLNTFGDWEEFTEIPLIFTNRIRGNNLNDIFVAGDYGIVAHYNGLNWNIFPEVNIALYHSLDYKNNIMIAVGERDGNAKILKMAKQ